MNLFHNRGIAGTVKRLEKERKSEVIGEKGELFQGLEDGKGLERTIPFSKYSDDGVAREYIGAMEMTENSDSEGRWVVADKTSCD